MKTFKTFFGLVELISCLALIVSCTKDNSIVFDNSKPLALEPGLEWAVIVSPYAAFREECSLDSKVSSHGRKGDVILVCGKEYIKNKDAERGFDIWYSFDQGWLSSVDVKVYDNELKAETASKELLN